MSNRLFEKSFLAFFNVACEKRGFRRAADLCRRFMVTVLTGICLWTIAPTVIAADTAQLSKVESAVVDAETQRFKAQIARDVAALKLAMADELVYTHASGRVQNKAEYLQGFESGSVRYQGIDVTERVVHVYGETGLTSGTITLDIGSKKLVSRYTGVYVKRDGRWQLVAWQATDIRS